MYIAVLKEDPQVESETSLSSYTELKGRTICFATIKELYDDIANLKKWDIYRIDKATPILIHAMIMEEEIEPATAGTQNNENAEMQ